MIGEAKPLACTAVRAEGDEFGRVRSVVGAYDGLRYGGAVDQIEVLVPFESGSAFTYPAFTYPAKGAPWA